MLDNDLLPYWPDQAIAAGLMDGLDLMVSHARDEATVFAMAMAPDAIPRDDEQLCRFLTGVGLDGNAMIPAYRAAHQAPRRGGRCLGLVDRPTDRPLDPRASHELPGRSCAKGQ
ncbi:MAG: hypothetical protein O2967_13930 [Proteobacteria bacterium]|nr:hypothetical protein [Pseudomonadota bacterium]